MSTPDRPMEPELASGTPRSLTRPVKSWGGSVLETARRRLTSGAAFLVACVVFLLLQLSGGHVVGALDHASSMLRMQMIQSAPSGDLVVVSIDSASLRAENTWPWPRERYARVIENLQGAGADLIAFDVDFSATSNPAGDAAMREAVDALPGSVVLPTFLQADAQHSNEPAATVGDMAILGNANVEIAPDGKVRRYRNGYQINGAYRPTLAAVLADVAYGDTTSFMLDYGVRVDEIPNLSFEAVHAGRFDPSLIAGRDVLIGATALELGDTFAVPVSPAMPGVFVHAAAYENIVAGRTLAELSRPVAIGVGLFALILLWPRRRVIDVPRFFAFHTAIALSVFLVPLAVQAVAPISLNIASILLAQGLCLWAGMRRELDRRNAEIASHREAHLTHIAMHDSETGMPNRRAMLERVDELLASGESDGVRVMVVGVEGFSALRAAIGFGKANDALVNFCQELETSFAGASTFRLSTSLIGVVSHSAADASGWAWMQSGFPDVDMTATVGEQNVQLRIRTGSACAESGAEGADDLIEHATIALDAARREDDPHRNYEDLPKADPRVRLAMVSGVEQGMELGEFEVVYQSKVSAADAQVCGAEALLRWDHPELGRMSPVDFIPVAEQTGAIDRLTLWVLDRAIADQWEARERGVYLPVSVNLSARTLISERFRRLAIQKIERQNADICFEITETAVIRSESAAVEAIAAFRAAGVKISIDDFGAGLSSLSYLKTLDADELKLDKALIADISTSQRDRDIVSSTIELAHRLGMTVVAEGVETEEMHRALSDLGCDILQGYWFERPIGAADFIEARVPDGSGRGGDAAAPPEPPSLRRVI